MKRSSTSKGRETDNAVVLEAPSDRSEPCNDCVDDVFALSNGRCLISLGPEGAECRPIFGREPCFLPRIALTAKRGGILGECHRDPSRSGIPKKCLSAMTMAIHTGIAELNLTTNSNEGCKKAVACDKASISMINTGGTRKMKDVSKALVLT